MDKRLEAPERVWIQEDRYGINLDGAFGAKPTDVDAVEYVRADLARSAPEPAPGEGSPSHPSGPSQDSQEVSEYPIMLVDNLRVCEGCLKGIGQMCHTPGCAFIRSRSLDMDVRESILLNGGTIRPEAPALSQSPKGAAGAGIDNAALTKEVFDFGKAAQLASDDTGLMRMALRSVACILKLVAPPPGASGAGDQGRPMKLEAEIDPTRQPGEAHIRVYQIRKTKDGHSRSNAGFFYCNNVEVNDEIAFRINAFEAAAPSPTTAGAATPDTIARGSEEWAARLGEPSAPKTGLRGAGAPGDGDPEHYGADALAWMREQAAALVGDHAKTWGPLYLSRAISLYIQKPAPAPGDVGEAGEADHG